MTTLAFLLVIGAIIFRATTHEDRLRFLQKARGLIAEANAYGRKELEPFWQALGERRSWPIATIAIAAVNVAMYLFMAIAPGSASDSATLIKWGASLGPRTTNGEWWRLVTFMLVNAGLFATIVNTWALVQIGLTLERLVGPAAFAATYVAAGLFAGLTSLAMYPMAVSAGASAGVFGLYGLLVAVFVWSWLRRSEVTIPIVAMTRLAPLAAVFLLRSIFEGNVGIVAEFVGLIVGLGLGFVAARDVAIQAPPPGRIGALLGAAAGIAVAAAIPLRGIADVEPEIQRLASIERRAAEAFKATNERFKQGKITATEAADVIDTGIVPEFERADRRLKELHGAPRETAPRLAAAREYLRLRAESWRLRSNALREVAVALRESSKGPDGSADSFRARAQKRHESTLRTFGKAEGAERASLQLLDRLTRPTDSHP